MTKQDSGPCPQPHTGARERLWEELGGLERGLVSSVTWFLLSPLFNLWPALESHPVWFPVGSELQILQPYGASVRGHRCLCHRSCVTSGSSSYSAVASPNSWLKNCPCCMPILTIPTFPRRQQGPPGAWSRAQMLARRPLGCLLGTLPWVVHTDLSLLAMVNQELPVSLQTMPCQ